MVFLSSFIIRVHRRRVLRRFSRVGYLLPGIVVLECATACVTNGGSGEGGSPTTTGAGGASMGDPHNCGLTGHDCLGGACEGGACQPVLVASGFFRISDMKVDA